VYWLPSLFWSKKKRLVADRLWSSQNAVCFTQTVTPFERWEKPLYICYFLLFIYLPTTTFTTPFKKEIVLIWNQTKKITKNCNIPQKNHKTDKTIKTSSSVKENLLVRIISWLALARTHHKVNKNPPSHKSSIPKILSSLYNFLALEN